MEERRSERARAVKNMGEWWARSESDNPIICLIFLPVPLHLFLCPMRRPWIFGKCGASLSLSLFLCLLPLPQSEEPSEPMTSAIAAKSHTDQDQLCNFEAAQNPQPQKKRVRRRRQSRRLYNQIPLNMAEARREIVTALKLHRASTKEAKQQQQKQDQQIKQSLEFCPCFEPEGRFKSRRNPRIYPGCFFYMENGSDFVAPPLVSQSLNFDDDFKSMDTSSVVCNDSHSSFYSLSVLPPSYICPSVSYAATHQEVPKSISLSEEEGKLMASDLFWSNNVPTGETEKEIQGAVKNDINHSFNKAMEFPDWLSVNDDFLQHGEEDYIQYPDLSRMDIGEIEDVDGDWLA